METPGLKTDTHNTLTIITSFIGLEAISEAYKVYAFSKSCPLSRLH